DSHEFDIRKSRSDRRARERRRHRRSLRQRSARFPGAAALRPRLRRALCLRRHRHCAVHLLAGRELPRLSACCRFRADRALHRRRELGQSPSVAGIWAAITSRSEMGWMAFVSIFIFVMWMYQVRFLMALLLGLHASFSSIQQFLTVVLTTNEGLLFLAIGNCIGAALSLILFS